MDPIETLYRPYRDSITLYRPYKDPTDPIGSRDPAPPQSNLAPCSGGAGGSPLRHPRARSPGAKPPLSAMRCPVLELRYLLRACPVLELRCLVRAVRNQKSDICYALATRCPVLTERVLVLPGRRHTTHYGR
eukprot:3326828-Rhodomonas_salina.2